MASRILVTDFDGTLTERDFFQLVTEQLLPDNTPDYWGQYLRREITHFEALQSIFGSVRVGEARLLEVVKQMKLEPGLRDLVRRLNQAGWQIKVASAGCRWYIDRLLGEAGVDLEVHANSGSIEHDRLWMTLPTDSPFFHPEIGIDKPGIVRDALRRATVVAFAGDGRPDLPAALLVPPHLRFARAMLAAELTARHETFVPFTRWSEVAEHLLSLESA